MHTLTVTSNCCEGAMNRMERDIVHWEDILESIVVRGVGTMTFEGEVVFGIGCLHVLDGNAAFDGSETEAHRLVAFRFVGENRHASMLILQRSVDGFILARLGFERVDEYSTVRCAHDRHWIEYISTVNPFLELDVHDRIGGAGIPELHGFVPTTGHDALIVRCFDPMHSSDGTLVRPDLNALV